MPFCMVLKCDSPKIRSTQTQGHFSYHTLLLLAAIVLSNCITWTASRHSYPHNPTANQTCQLAECMPEWVPSPWGPCSKLCGTGGWQSRSVQCQKIISNGYPTIVDENQCFRRLGDKPAEEHQKCNVNVPCPTWFIGLWKPCDKLCGDGKQTRQVVCHRKTNGRVEVLVDESCEDEKPVTEQPCNIHPCDGIDWVVSSWTGCDSCVSKLYTREALCVTKDRQVVQPELCWYHRKPELAKPCNEMALPPCEGQWYAAQWSNCSVDCGVGVKTRKVFCGFHDGFSVQEDDDSKCDADAKYNNTAPCEVLAENCPARWYAAAWSECTKECGGGEQYRKAMCLSGGNASTSCPEAEMPDEEKSCNLEPCNIDELPSVSSTTEIYDDLPECVEEGEEVDAELLSSTSLSDASSTPAHWDFFTVLSTTKPRCRPRNNPFKCTTSKFGCCPDKKTPAGGPFDEGCPSVSPAGGPRNRDCPVPNCEETLYGCCKSDRKTPAEGNDQEGCPSACKFSNTSEFGCCDDGQTAAHGPNKLGCCLLTPHGCCPDNFQPAKGANLEGCDCKNSPFGCCPDQKSYATGANHTGCGCEHTPHGCCPDRRTEATGPNLEGCSCHTSQFGCCPDGVTAAIGFNLQGCRCEESQHGCCGDGVTPATGPNKEGCDCASSKYGCCPDGVTEPQSENFTGCAVALINKQAACALSYEKGNCTNYSIQWFYDMDYGGCSRFHYGGCGGNGNRFAEKAECEAVCIKPAPRDTCHLPKVMGTCKTPTVRWYYDDNYQRCLQFHWGGCLGNQNNFETQIACEKQCSPKLDEEKDKCTLPASPGECRIFQLRWFFDTKHQQCRQFPYGGCGGNANNFLSEDLCNLECSVPATPPPASQEATCLQPTDAGGCSGSEERWTYSPESKKCVPFKYTGCGGNANNFPSKEYCEFTCRPPQDICEMPKEVGPCRAAIQRWYYDRDHGECQEFIYGGCFGNKNNFETKEECRIGCELTRMPPTPAPPQDVCSLAPEVGPCRAAYQRFYYNPAAGRCEAFTYGGCGGNQNSFESAQECEQRCAPPAVPPRNIPTECRVASLDQCRGVGRVWYLDPASLRCTQHDPQPGTPSCNLPGIFVSPEACERACGDFRDIAACALPYETGNCTNYSIRWFYDMDYGGCSRFHYSGCGGNGNRFADMAECEAVCIKPAPRDACHLPKVKGSCSNSTVRWYYDDNYQRCLQFHWGGCLGNNNNYKTQEECEKQCSPTLDEERQCQLPIEKGPCAGNYSRWGYTETTGSCEEFLWGGCQGNPNRFISEAACMLKCNPPGKKKPVCDQPQDTGPCTEINPYWSYSKKENRCVPFYYGGCGGNENKFSTQEQCEDACPKSYKIDKCTLPASPGGCRIFQLRWFFDTKHQQCRQFSYGGCGGNANNFVSKDLCKLECSVPATPPPASQEDICELPREVGPCRAAKPRWYYDRDNQQCQHFSYGGCSGNKNNFETEEECRIGCVLTRVPLLQTK